MANFIIKINIEKEIEAEDEDDAIEKYFLDIEENYTNSFELELENHIKVVKK